MSAFRLAPALQPMAAVGHWANWGHRDPVFGRNDPTMTGKVPLVSNSRAGMVNNPKFLEWASTAKPSDWGAYSTALTNFVAPNPDDPAPASIFNHCGMAFNYCMWDHFVCIDVDRKKLDANDPRIKWTGDVLTEADTITEASWSRKGWHAFGYTDDVELMQRMRRVRSINGCIDMFGGFGYVAFTGSYVNIKKPLRDLSHVVGKLLDFDDAQHPDKNRAPVRESKLPPISFDFGRRNDMTDLEALTHLKTVNKTSNALLRGHAYHPAGYSEMFKQIIGDLDKYIADPEQIWRIFVQSPFHRNAGRSEGNTGQDRMLRNERTFGLTMNACRESNAILLQQRAGQKAANAVMFSDLKLNGQPL